IAATAAARILRIPDIVAPGPQSAASRQGANAIVTELHGPVLMPMSTPSVPQASQRPAPGRPKDLAKRAAILEAAESLFLEHGFEGVSMDQIAARAGVSKLTVYSHFGDKDALFFEAVEHYCDKQVPSALFTPAPQQPLRERLAGIGRAVYALMASPEAVAGFRLMCASLRA